MSSHVLPLFEMLRDKVGAVLLSPASHFSLLSLGCALLIALGATHFRSKRGRRIRVLVRALFPRRMFTAPSSRADLGFFLFNLFLASLLFGGAILSFEMVAAFARGLLIDVFGASARTGLPGVLIAGMTTITLYLAYELAYWLNHAASHKIPFFWEFHKVHHSAELLTPLTNYRVHPVDSIFFYNTVALVTGIAQGGLDFAFGMPATAFTVSGANIALLASTFLLLHLQHSHLWIAFGDRWGRVFLSPAHHQIHHSINPDHFGRNFGSSLALFDRLAGTLHVPRQQRERLEFGVEPRLPSAHGVTGGLVTPFADAWATLMPQPLAKPRAPEIAVRG